jgi:uncharacterized membrane protein YcaP (DUF421 family)
MDPLRVAVRAAFAFVVLLLLVRAAGKRAVKQGSAFEFAVALILGDLVDDVLWGEVSAAMFVVASAAIVTAHVVCGALAFAAGGRRWPRAG